MPNDFPNSPTVGQIVTFPNGQAYRWNGGQWDFIVGAQSEYPKVTGFGSNGTWTPDPKMVHGYMWALSGGGGGGGCAVVTANYYGCAGGGGGTTVTLWFKKADITLSSYPVTIGGGGAGGNGGTGGTGGDSSVGSILVAKGSVGGGLYGPGYATIAGNIGHSPVYGATGGMGMQGPQGTGTIGFGGSGGGTGGSGASVGGAGGAATGGAAAANSGGGGGGGAANNAGPGNIVGGPGGSGVVYIVEYCFG